MNPKFKTSEAQDRTCIPFQISNPRCFGFGNTTVKGSVEKTQVYYPLESWSESSQAFLKSKPFKEFSQSNNQLCFTVHPEQSSELECMR